MGPARERLTSKAYASKRAIIAGEPRNGRRYWDVRVEWHAGATSHPTDLVTSGFSPS